MPSTLAWSVSFSRPSEKQVINLVWPYPIDLVTMYQCISMTQLSLRNAKRHSSCCTLALSKYVHHDLQRLQIPLTLVLWSTMKLVSGSAKVLVSCLLLVLASALNSSRPNAVNVRVDLSRVNRTVHSDFLSVTISAGAIESNWHGVDLRLPRLINMAKALVPCTLRVGGTAEDFILYSVSRSSYSNSVDGLKPSGKSKRFICH